MPPQRWTIPTQRTGHPRDVEVVLYDNLSRMRGAATRHGNLWDGDHASLSNALAVTHGFRVINIKPGGTEEEQPLSAIIRFARSHITPEIVAHEVAHVAQHLYGLDCLTPDSVTKDHFNTSNETFAYLLGDLFGAVWSLVSADMLTA